MVEISKWVEDECRKQVVSFKSRPSRDLGTNFSRIDLLPKNCGPFVETTPTLEPSTASHPPSPQPTSVGSSCHPGHQYPQSQLTDKKTYKHNTTQVEEHDARQVNGNSMALVGRSLAEGISFPLFPAALAVTGIRSIHSIHHSFPTLVPWIHNRYSIGSFIDGTMSFPHHRSSMMLSLHRTPTSTGRCTSIARWRQLGLVVSLW